MKYIILKYIVLHGIAFTIGIILDLLIGDPHKLPHPIRLIGNLIGKLDKLFMGEKENVSENPSKEFWQGIAICIITIGLTFVLTTGVVAGAYLLNDYAGVAIEAVLTFYLLAAKSLYNESMKVYKSLVKGDLEEARYNVSMIVGRDTKRLDEIGVAKAATETVAENTSDGVIAPMMYAIVGGPILAFVYKAINTMDSMIGYHNNRYEYLGKTAARLDDIVNYIPSRLSALFMVLASFILGIFSKKFSGTAAFKIWRRDRRNHKSPNSAQTESVCAGSLGIKLAGPASYFGVIHDKPFIGDEVNEISYEDIKLANVLMFVTEAICFVVSISIIILLVSLLI